MKQLPEEITLLGLLVPALLGLLIGSREAWLFALLFATLPSALFQTLPLSLWLRRVRTYSLAFRLPPPLLTVFTNSAGLLCVDYSADALNSVSLLFLPLYLLIPTLLLILGTHLIHRLVTR